VTFLTPLFLYGAAFVALPVVLHLVMRRKPKHFEFPALRFVQVRHDTNRRRLRLRHLLLLALRVLAIALLAMALARPSIRLGSDWGSQEAPVAAALVFDTSMRMEYRHQNRTRLEAAQELALTLIGRLPRNSQLAVLDTRWAPAAFQVDLGAAKHRIKRMEPAAHVRPLAAVLVDAARLLATSELTRREVYLFTDLTRVAWPEEAASRLREQLGRSSEVGVYLIDVGVPSPTNTALGDLKLSAQVISAHSTLSIETELAQSGPAAKRTVELYVDGVRKGAQTVAVEPGQSQRLEFPVGDLALGTHQGRLQIVGQDGLACDDQRFFTVEVHPPWKILLVAPPPERRYAVFLAQALAPTSYRRTGQAPFECEILSQDALAAKPLDGYAAVCLLDPKPLEPVLWQKLTNYANDGHGVGVFLGRNALQTDSFNAPAAQELLAGRLKRVVKSADGTWLTPQNLSHPVLDAFRDLPGSVPWDAFPVFRSWQLDVPPTGVRTLVVYSDGRPAILERDLGRGRVLVMTTPVSDQADAQAWNLLPVGDAWPFLILANGMTSYLAGSRQQPLNYFAGQAVVLPVDPSKEISTYLLKSPGAGQIEQRLTPDRKANLLRVTATDAPGNYRVQAGGQAGGVDRGFSINLSRQETDLERIGEDQLKKLFGNHTFRLAHDLRQLEGKVTEARVGRDLFPFLVVLLALILAAEHCLANRFYRS
jgi:hypothetical protein